MSAYLCEAKHIGAIASFLGSDRGQVSYVERHLEKGTAIAESEPIAVRVGVELGRENLRSVSARYPHDNGDGDRPGEAHDSDTDYLARCSQCSRLFLPSVNPARMLKALDCYEYQACETNDYPQSRAANLIKLARARAIRALPEYEDAAWGWDAR